MTVFNVNFFAFLILGLIHRALLIPVYVVGNTVMDESKCLSRKEGDEVR
jgi:hypothetical protein